MLGASSVSLEQLPSYQEWKTCSDRNKSFLNKGRIIFWVCHIVNIYSTSCRTGSLSAGEKLNMKITEVNCIEKFLTSKGSSFLLCHETHTAAGLHSDICNVSHGSWPCQVCFMIHILYNWSCSPSWSKTTLKVVILPPSGCIVSLCITQRKAPSTSQTTWSTVTFYRYQSTSIWSDTIVSLS